MSEVQLLQLGYRGIATASTVPGAIDAYADFHQMLGEVQPPSEVIIEATEQDYAVLKAISTVRNGKNGLGERYFKGSGIIVVGDSDGNLLGANYDEADGDPVAEKYENYQYVALRKAGLAAMVGRIGIFPDFGSSSYARIQAILEEKGLSTPKEPHHLGYAANLINGTSRFLTAGASGMLPSEKVRQHFHNIYAEQFKRDRERGWYEWEGDEAAGLHDAVAALSVVLKLTRTEEQFPHDLLPLTPSDPDKSNIH